MHNSIPQSSHNTLTQGGTTSYAALATLAQMQGGVNEQAMKILDEHAALAKHFLESGELMRIRRESEPSLGGGHRC